MRIILLFVLSLSFCAVKAQSSPDTTKSRVFAATGLGFGFPLGGVKKTLSPRVSNTVGFNIPLKNKKYFIYPLIDFMTYGYNQTEVDEDYDFQLNNGSANVYGLSIMPGLNQFLGSLRLYAFGGPFAQLIFEPRIATNSQINIATIEDKVYFTGGVRASVGAHYQLGDFYLFFESGVLRNFTKIENEPVYILTTHGGLKTDITNLTDKLGKIF